MNDIEDLVVKLRKWVRGADSSACSSERRCSTRSSERREQSSNALLAQALILITHTIAPSPIEALRQEIAILHKMPNLIQLIKRN